MISIRRWCAIRASPKRSATWCWKAGDATQQATIDRFVNGESVPYAQLRKVWTDTPSNDPTQFFIGMINIFDTVRAVNRKLPADQRIKVWLSDPPIDWSKIHTKAELDPVIAQRETYPADLIGREILAKGKKALVIYGNEHFTDFTGLHFTRLQPGQSARTGGKRRIWRFLHREIALYGVTPPMPARRSLKSTSRIGPRPLWCAHSRHVAGSRYSSAGLQRAPDQPGTSREVYAAFMANWAGLTADALLYLRPRKQLMWSPWTPDIYLDADFRAELDRRHQIRGYKPMGTDWNARENPAMLTHYFPN